MRLAFLAWPQPGRWLSCWCGRRCRRRGTRRRRMGRRWLVGGSRRLGSGFAGFFACAALWWWLLLCWPLLDLLVVYWRCPCAGRHLLLFAGRVQTGDIADRCARTWLTLPGTKTPGPDHALERKRHHEPQTGICSSGQSAHAHGHRTVRAL